MLPQESREHANVRRGLLPLNQSGSAWCVQPSSVTKRTSGSARQPSTHASVTESCSPRKQSAGHRTRAKVPTRQRLHLSRPAIAPLPLQMVPAWAYASARRAGWPRPLSSSHPAVGHSVALAAPPPARARFEI